MHKRSRFETNPTAHIGAPSERLALARRLHDTLAQDLARIGYKLDVVIGDGSLPPELRHELRVIRLMAMDITQRFRDEIYRIRQTKRDELREILEEILAGRSLEINDDYPALTSDVESSLNQAIIEIARNSVKHSGASHFYLTHEENPEGFTLFVGDNGSGTIKNHKGGFGLRGIDEILSSISQGYECRADSNGTHFVIHFHLPPTSTSPRSGS